LADIHPFVLDLLEPVRTSAASALYAIAIARIEAAESGLPPTDDPDEERDPFAPREGEDERDRARRHVKAADIAIRGLLERELAIFERSEDLLADFNTAQPRGALNMLYTIAVTPPPSDSKTGGEEGDVPDTISAAPDSGTNLLAPARREALSTMLTAWNDAVRATLERIEQEPEAEPGL